MVPHIPHGMVPRITTHPPCHAASSPSPTPPPPPPDCSEALLHLLSTLLLVIPTSLRSLAPQLEPQLAAISTAAGAGPEVKRGAVRCLVLMARAQGDAATYSNTARRCGGEGGNGLHCGGATKCLFRVQAGWRHG